MKWRAHYPVVAVLFASLCLPPFAFAQKLPANTNRSSSSKLKSRIASGSANLILSNSLTSFIGGGSLNRIEPYVASGFIGGGGDNSISASTNASRTNLTLGSVIGGGIYNSANGAVTTIGGGATNTAEGTAVTIAGGDNNNALSDSSVIGGGSFNRILNYASTSVIGGGSDNVITNTNNVPDPLGAQGSVIAGGIGNRIAASDFIDLAGPGVFPPTVLRPATATVGGGLANKADGAQSTVGGGFSNAVAGTWATVAGGRENNATGSSATVAGGLRNKATELFATVSGGSRNSNAAYAGFIGGGVANAVTAIASSSVIGGGESNVVVQVNAVIAGGLENTVAGSGGFIGGGSQNTNSGNFATLGGGGGNTIVGGGLTVGRFSTIGGGVGNTNNGAERATIGGGAYNTISASAAYATVPGGTKAIASHPGSFVWSGDSSETTESFGNETFTVRAEGGVRFYTGNGTSIGAFLGSGGSWQVASDSNLKTKVTAVDPRAILSKVAAMPVTEWEYKAVPNRRFIGPMAQDFRAAFGLGDDDKSISTLDSDGVMYAAIQGLVEELKERDKAIEELKSELRTIREQLSNLPPAP